MDPEKEKGIEAGTASKYTTDISGKKDSDSGRKYDP